MYRCPKQKALSHETGLFVAPEILEQGVVDGAEGIADLGSEQAHNSDNDDGDESQNDSVLDQTLTFFLGCEQHGGNSFLNKRVVLPEDRPQNFAYCILFT